MDVISKYFPNLLPDQVQKLEQLGPLYKEWNEKINVISRKDIDNLYERHILHSMSIARFIHFKPGTKVLDIGTGGGIPGIPLAILFPETEFKLIDGTLKKIKVVQAIVDALGLKNVTAQQIRSEELKERFDFVVCRGVARLEQLNFWCSKLIKKEELHGLPNGLIALKGGNVSNEIKELGRGAYTEEVRLADFFEEAFYEEKYIIYVQI